jgi:hypothetical protein
MACGIRRGLDISNNIIGHHDTGSPHQDPPSANDFVHSPVALSLLDDTVIFQALNSKLRGLQLLRDKFLEARSSLMAKSLVDNSWPSRDTSS